MAKKKTDEKVAKKVVKKEAVKKATKVVKKEAVKKTAEKKGNEKVSEVKVEEKRKGSRRKNDKREGRNLLSYFAILFAITTFIIVIITSVSTSEKVELIEGEIDKNSSSISKNLNSISSVTSSLKNETSEIKKNIIDNKEKINNVGNLAIKNAGDIDDLEGRVFTAQRGVNHLVRIQMISHGYSDSLALAISNEISVNPTISKWNTLISNSKFNFEELNTKIDNLNSKSSVNSSDIESVNKKVEELEDLLQKKNQLVLKLLKKHGTRSMKKFLKNK